MNQSRRTYWKHKVISLRAQITPLHHKHYISGGKQTENINTQLFSIDTILFQEENDNKHTNLTQYIYM